MGFFSYNFGNRMTIRRCPPITWMVCDQCGCLVDSEYMGTHEHVCPGRTT